METFKQPGQHTDAPRTATPTRYVPLCIVAALSVMVFSTRLFGQDPVEAPSPPQGEGELSILVMDWKRSVPIRGATVRLLDGTGLRWTADEISTPGWYVFENLPTGEYPTLTVAAEGYATAIRKRIKVKEAGASATFAVLLIDRPVLESLPWRDPERLKALEKERAGRQRRMEAMGYEFDAEGNILRTPEDKRRELEDWESGPAEEEASQGGVMTLTVRGKKISSTVESALRVRTDMSTACDFATAKEMKKTGDSNASDAMRRVVGVSVVGGKYVYVRGLGERYSITLLNNAYLPSPEPDKRVVPLDLFPTSLLDRIQVTKTYSADLPGEFSGGTVQIFTKTVPAGRQFQVGLSLKGDGDSTGKTFNTYRGGRTDWLGMDDGTRSLPGAVPENDKVTLGGWLGGFTQDELEVIGQSFQNIWQTRQETAPPGAGLSALYGDRYGPFGFFTSLSWSNSWSIEEYKKISYKNAGSTNDPHLVVKNDYDFHESNFSAQVSNLTVVGAEFDKNHSVNLTFFYVNSGKDKVRIYEGFYNDTQLDIRTTNIVWDERSLMHFQLSGSHAFLNPLLRLAPGDGNGKEGGKKADAGKDLLKADWRLTYSQSTADSPNRRQIRYDWDEGTDSWLWVDRPATNERNFFDLDESILEGGLDLTVPYRAMAGNHAVKAGGVYLSRERHFRARSLRYRPRNDPPQYESGGDVDLHDLNPENLFNEDTIWEDGWQIEESTRATDEYTATQSLIAAYLVTDFHLHEDWTLNAGVRIESAVQTVSSFDPFAPDVTTIDSEIANVDILPALNLKWAFLERMQLRLSASQTVNRPEFREQAEFEFTDVMGEYPVKGNSNLERALIRNFDLRYEFFPKAGEVFAVSLFYKHFENPVEKILQPTTEFRISYGNAESAVNYGAEMELRLGLGYLGRFFEKVQFVFNASVIQSEVDLSELGGVQTSSRRALQGQSPYMINAVLIWNSNEGCDLFTGWGVTLAFNTAGRRISSVGAAGLPEIYEEARYDLKLIVSKKLPGGGSASLQLGNLLLDHTHYTQGGKDVVTGDGALEFKFGLSWSF